MKKFFQLVLSCSVLAAIPLLLFIASVYPTFRVYASRWDNRTCAKYYIGESKGMLWENGEWHHYVDFRVDESAPARSWRVIEGPVDSSILRSYMDNPSVRRVTYRWPSNWWDPFPASSWTICLLDS
jgi:hypothetical protein